MLVARFISNYKRVCLLLSGDVRSTLDGFVGHGKTQEQLDFYGHLEIGNYCLVPLVKRPEVDCSNAIGQDSSVLL